MTQIRKLNYDQQNQQNSMSQSKPLSNQQQSNTNIYDQQYYLNTVIDCIVDNRNSPKSIESTSMAILRKRKTKIDQNNSRDNSNLEKQKQINLPELFGKAGQLVAQFDNSINRCKKYNEAKVNRKYQIVIKDLQAEIRKLTQKLKLQQEARSPTKKHISQILDKLVSYKDQNQVLQKDLQLSRKKIDQLQDKLQIQANALLKLQNQTKTTIERLPAIQSNYNSNINLSSNAGNNLLSNSVNQDVKAFLKDKEKVRSINGHPPSNLQKYLNNNRSKMWNWNLVNLLQELDKWAQGIKQRQDVDMWKIRSGIARKFSDMIDQPNALIMPSVLTTQKTQKHYISPPVYPAYSQPQRKKRFSAFDFKSSRNKSSISDSKRILESSMS